MTGVRLTLKGVRARPVVGPLRRPVVSKVGLFRDWPMILIDLYTNEGVVGHSYLEPYLRQSMRYIIAAIEDLADAAKGQPVAPFDGYRRGIGSLHLVGREGVSLIAVSGLDIRTGAGSDRSPARCDAGQARRVIVRAGRNRPLGPLLRFRRGARRHAGLRRETTAALAGRMLTDPLPTGTLSQRPGPPHSSPLVLAHGGGVSARPQLAAVGSAGTGEVLAYCVSYSSW